MLQKVITHIYTKSHRSRQSRLMTIFIYQYHW